MGVRALGKSRQAGAVVIPWFCAQHIKDGIQRMMKGLVGQLLDQSLAGINISRLDQVGRANDVFDKIKLLGFCIKEQLRFSPVYCVIDAVSFYEVSQRSRDLCRAFNRLAELENDSGHEHAFKLLVTSPTRAIDVCESSAAAGCVVLDAEDEVGGSISDLDEMDALEHTWASLRRRQTGRRVYRSEYV